MRSALRILRAWVRIRVGSGALVLQPRRPWLLQVDDYDRQVVCGACVVRFANEALSHRLLQRRGPSCPAHLESSLVGTGVRKPPSWPPRCRLSHSPLPPQAPAPAPATHPSTRRGRRVLVHVRVCPRPPPVSI